MPRTGFLGANGWRGSFAALLGVLLFLVPCVAGAETGVDSLVDAYVEVWNTGDVDRLEKLVTPDFRRHAGADEAVDSRAALAEFITQTRGIYDRLRISVEDSVSAAEGGAFRGSFYGVHKAVNGVVEFPVMSMMRVADGKIAEEWIVGDNFMSLMALGYELVPPGFEAIPPEVGTRTEIDADGGGDETDLGSSSEKDGS